MSARPVIPLSVPSLTGNERSYVDECLETNWISTAGPFVGRFERAVCELLGVEQAVATSSGSAALHVALLASGIRPDDEVIVPALTYVASANAVRHAGAWPVFVDVDPDYWQLDPERVAAFLEQDCTPGPDGPIDGRTGRRVGGILPVHLLGHPVELDPLLELATRHGLAVVEDAAESFGASFQRRDGSWAPTGTIARAGCLSFNGNKTVTSGGGGMVVTNDVGLADEVRSLVSMAERNGDEYAHATVGYNYRLTNLHAAVGCAQVERAEELVADRRRIAAAYRKAFAGHDRVSFMAEAEWARSTCWLSTVLVDDSHAVMGSLHAEGIESRPLWEPLNRSAAFADPAAFTCEVAESVAARGLCLPSSFGLTEDEQQRVIEVVLAEA